MTPAWQQDMKCSSSISCSATRGACSQPRNQQHHWAPPRVASALSTRPDCVRENMCAARRVCQVLQVPLLSPAAPLEAATGRSGGRGPASKHNCSQWQPQAQHHITCNPRALRNSSPSCQCTREQHGNSPQHHPWRPSAAAHHHAAAQSPSSRAAANNQKQGGPGPAPKCPFPVACQRWVALRTASLVRACAHNRGTPHSSRTITTHPPHDWSCARSCPCAPPQPGGAAGSSQSGSRSGLLWSRPPAVTIMLPCRRVTNSSAASCCFSMWCCSSLGGSSSGSERPEACGGRCNAGTAE